MKRRSARRTAYHEAGHAFAAARLHIPFQYVTIVPDEGRRTLGHVVLARLPGEKDWNALTPNGRARIEKMIIVMLAGREAERLVLPRYDHAGASGDYRAAADSVLRLVGDPTEAKAYLRWLDIRAKNLIRAPHARPLIDAIAASLLDEKFMTAERVTQLMRNTILRLQEERSVKQRRRHVQM